MSFQSSSPTGCQGYNEIFQALSRPVAFRSDSCCQTLRIILFMAIRQRRLATLTSTGCPAAGTSLISAGLFSWARKGLAASLGAHHLADLLGAPLPSWYRCFPYCSDAARCHRCWPDPPYQMNRRASPVQHAKNCSKRPRSSARPGGAQNYVTLTDFLDERAYALQSPSRRV